VFFCEENFRKGIDKENLEFKVKSMKSETKKNEMEKYKEILNSLKVDCWSFRNEWGFSVKKLGENEFSFMDDRREIVYSLDSAVEKICNLLK